jgi:hypothetical protein
MAIGRAPDNPVLVIERDADLLSAVGRALRSRGYEVVAVPTVDEGIAQLRMRGACFIVLGLTDLGEGRRFREHQLGSPTLGEIPVLVYADAADAVVNDRALGRRSPSPETARPEGAHRPRRPLLPAQGRSRLD